MKCHHILGHLYIWSPVGYTVWVAVGDLAFLGGNMSPSVWALSIHSLALVSSVLSAFCLCFKCGCHPCREPYCYGIRSPK